jgi:hypothetical protein
VGEQAKAKPSKGAGGQGAEGEGLPTLDFSTFVLSMSHSALLHLGETPNPETNALERSLPLARQTIDLIALLEEKTKGNLTGDEERLITQILFDLRMRYLEHSKKGNAEK